MSEVSLIVPKRTDKGKAASRDLRKQGHIPAVLYGLDRPPVNIAVSPKLLARIISSESGLNSVMTIEIQGETEKDHAIIKDVQRHPVTDRLLHVDLMRVDPTHKVRVKVPLHLTGTPLGVKEGGMLDFPHREIEVECLPSVIPANVTIDISALRVGDSIRFDEIALIPSVKLISDPHTVVCSIHAKHAGSEDELAPAPEPEVATKGKKEKE